VKPTYLITVKMLNKILNTTTPTKNRVKKQSPTDKP